MATLPPRNPVAEAFQRCIAMDASLGEQLAAFAASTAGYNAPFAAAIETLVARLQEFEVGSGAPGPGEIMPPFSLPDGEGRLVGLSDLLERGPAVMIFHRGHWCPFCRINSIAIARAQHRIERLGGQMVAIMPDRHPYPEILRSVAGSTFPFLTDADNGYAMSINLVFWVGEAMQRFIASVGNDVPRYQGNNSWLLPVPATFVIGQDGRVAARHVDPDYRKRMEVVDLIAAVARAAGVEGQDGAGL